MVGRTLRKTGSAISDSIRRTFSRKTWEHKEQLHSLRESDRFFLAKVRWQIAWMAHIGFAIAFGIRSNFGVAKNRMINNFTDSYGQIHEQEFFWTPTELGMMESSFFYGYAASQIPAGLLAAKFAPNKLLCIGVFVASLLNILIAFLLQYHPVTDIAVMSLQVVQGLALGVTYPAMHGVWRHWAPPLERSKLATTTFTGSYVGVMVGLPASAYLVSHFHWSAPFFVFGVVGVVWSAVWWFISSKSPLCHRYISNEERTYISEKVGAVAVQDMSLTTVPWKSILLSPAVWAIVICNFCRSWTFFLLLGNQLTYMKDVLHIDITNSGLISMLPQLLMTITVLSSGQAADYLRSSGKMETRNVRKLFNTVGFSGEAVFLCMLAFVREPIWAIVCLITGCALSGLSIAGFNVNHFDIAPRYAPILMGFSNGFGALAGMSGFVTQSLTLNNPDGWKWCFLLAMSVDLFGIVFFLIFGRGEVQSWAREPEREETLGEFCRRISMSVANRLSRRSSRNPSTYEKMEEERQNSSEMKARSPSTDSGAPSEVVVPNFGNSISGKLTAVAEEDSTSSDSSEPPRRLTTDRPQV
ncbi:unnamed protein product [Caenorhabditis auriculariae]|uniref:Major facilitator superfamily (MFS) profile domain-containing protein n=1 Tax=Caenorhabditis auriculariae TaxID=2777116 RepID=A0A8S1H4D6_9PELO|nr:unnamed protein product [Caenorhabditis auriculariae]